jgi:spermidine synthase
MCALALEVMWTRALSLSIGTTTYSFTVMLAAFLIGIWIGSWLHALFPLRRIPIHAQLGGVMILIGVSSFLASYAIPRLPDIVVQLNVGIYGSMEPRIRPATALLAGFVVMLVPSVFMGVAFPLSGEARARLGPSFGRSAGDTLGWNTLGSVVGSLLAGFALIPYMGLQRGMLLAAGIYAAYGFLAAAAPWLAGSSRHRWVSLGATASLMLLALSVPAWVPPWDVRVIGGFQNNQMARYVDQDGEVSVREELAKAVVLYYREGHTSTVSVVDQNANWVLLVNGKVVAGDGPLDIDLELMMGHVPLLAHPNPKKALVVGLGTGITLGSVTAHESLEEITLVEIEPAIIGAQPYFTPVSGDPLSDPRLSVEIQDGRNYLKTTNEVFDVITADPIHPWNQGSSYLFTSEYYAIAKQRLNAGGIMCQWLPLYGLSTGNVKSIVATFNAAFAHTMLWQNGIDSVLIGSDSPIRIDLFDLATRLKEPSIAAQLAVIGLGDPYSFAAELALDRKSIREYARGAIITTDDNLHLEFASPFDIGTTAVDENWRELNRYRIRIKEDRELLILSEPEREAVARSRKAKFETLGIRLRPDSPRDRIRSMRRVLEEFPDYPRARQLLSQLIAERGAAAIRNSRIRAGIGYLEEAVELDPLSAHAHRSLGAALLNSGRFEESIHHLERSMELRQGRWRTYALRSRALLGAGRVTEAEESLRLAIDINPHHPGLAAQMASLRSAEGARALP